MPLASRSFAHLLLAAGVLFGCAPAAPAPLPEPAEGVEGAVQPRSGQVIEIPPLHPRYRPPPPPDDTLAERGLEFRLREAPSETVPTPTPVRPATARGTPLSAAETSALLRRLPPLPAAEEREAFLFPAASPPPPRTGALVLAPFPPPDTVAPPAPGPVAPAALEVVRITPTGEVNDLAPHLTITFSQPMVPLSSVAEVHAREVPARLTPQPPGRWQWIDTRTLRFEPQQRFPMATRFAVEIPAGTRSELGATLPEPVRAEFATPAPRAIGGYPHRAVTPAVGLEPLILLVFDQRIDPAAALRTIEIRAGRSIHRARAATEREIAADSLIRVLTEEAPEGRWLALRPAQPLPRASEVRVVVRPGALSAEGPRATAEAQELPFRTYGPLRVEEHRCGWGEDECFPGMPWQIRFSNPLDERAWSEARVRIEPEVPDLRIQLIREHLVILGDTRPRTTYRVTLDAELRDIFGQRLGAMQTLTFTVGDHPPLVRLPGAPLVVLDPGGPPRLPVHSRGYDSLSVRLYRISPEQWNAFAAAVQRYLEGRGDTRLQPPGEQVAAYTVRPEGGRIGFSETMIDLTPALTGGLGHAIVVVDPLDAPPAGRDPRRMRYGPQMGFAWVQATRLGLSAAVDNRELLGWVTSLETGEPLGGIELSLLPSGTRAVTDRQGLATLALSPEGDGLLVARRGQDVALLPDREPLYREPDGRGSWRRQEEPVELSWFLFTDRGLYRPGEDVRLKGWMRRLEIGPDADPALPRVERVRYTLADPRGEEIGKGEARPGALGGFDLAFELPEAINLGHAQLRLEAHGPAVPQQGRETGHHFAVQEFRRPEYEVTLELDPGPHVVGTTLAPTLRAAYFGGGGLAEAEVEWRVMSRPADFTPPGWTGWSFGRPLWPWGPGWGSAGRPRQEQLTSRTDARGLHRVLIELLSVDPPFPNRLHAAAEVRDVNRQAGSATQDLVIHPAMIYAGLRAERAWIRPGDSLVVRVIAVDPGGTVVPGRRVQVRAERMEWRPVPRGGGEWGPVEEVGRCDIVSGSDPVSCTFVPEKGGTLRITAEVRDEAERPSRTEMIAWVAGGPPTPPLPDRPAAGEVQLVPDREEYQPGQVAEILVQPPFHPAEATLTLRRGGILETRRFRIEGEAHILRLPITEAYLPGVQVHVELVDAESGLRFARGEARLSIPPRRRELAVRVTPRDSVLEPGAETTVEVEVRRADGRPAAGAEVALWMVDEAVLSLGAYRLPDPLETFYPQRYHGVRDHELRSRVVLTPRSAGPGTVSAIVVDAESATSLRGVQATLVGTGRGAITDQRGEFTIRDVPAGSYTLELAGIGYGAMQVPVRVPAEGVHLGTLFLRSERMQLEAIAVADGRPPPPAPPPTAERAMIRARDVQQADMAAGEAPDPVALRADFAPLALFEPSLRTGPDGRVRVPARLPGSLTRYRVMAVAVEGATLYGRGEASLTARRELMARPSLPRFLNFGDRVEIPVVVQNLTTAPLEVNVALRASGLTVAEPGGQRVTVPAEDRIELRFPAAADQVGRARVQVVAAAGNLSDAAAIELPVYTPATTEAFATYGEIDTGSPVVLPVQLPGGVIEDFGGLEITTTSTALQQLTDAVLYLKSYPFEGAEQLASRILAVAALRDVLSAFAAEGLPPPQEVADATTRDIRTLVGLQNPDGGWSYWRRDLPSIPFVSIHAAHALQRARENDFAVPDETMQRAQMYLREIERHLAQESEGRMHGDERARHALASYALYVRHRMGDQGAVREARQRLQSTRAELLTVEAMGWLLHTLAGNAEARTDAAELVRRIQNRAEETAATATFTTAYGEGEHLLLHSDRRSDAVVLEALIAADPQSELIPKVARGLLAHRVQGRWRTTQENAWVLLALERYFATYERVTPDFRARVWLGERFAGGHAFRGRTTERHHLEIPLGQIASANGSSGDTLRSTPPARENLILAREGEGRMYYRAGLRYAPADLTLDPAQRGFIVTRSYEAVDDTADVRRDADGTWRVRAGARVRVRVSLTAPSRRYHVALADPLPAGFEPLNPELAGVGFTEDEGGIRPPPPPPGVRVAPERLMPPPWRWQWYIHQNLRDDRAEAFADLLSAGSHEYVYLARATTPGHFIVPPPRAEEMYHPETFGRGESDRVVVEAGR